jgi:hypothetical protein
LRVVYRPTNVRVMNVARRHWQPESLERQGGGSRATVESIPGAIAVTAPAARGERELWHAVTLGAPITGRLEEFLDSRDGE